MYGYAEQTIIADAALLKGNAARALLDLRDCIGAVIHVAVGRSDVTALVGAPTSGAKVVVRALGVGGTLVHPSGAVPIYVTNPTGTAATTITAATSAGTFPATVTLTTATSFTGEQVGCLWGNTSGTATVPSGLANGAALPNLEFVGTSYLATTTLYLQDPLQNTHVSGETITVGADCYTYQVYGGAVYSVLIDYGDNTTGDALAVRAYAQIQFDRP